MPLSKQSAATLTAIDSAIIEIGKCWPLLPDPAKTKLLKLNASLCNLTRHLKRLDLKPRRPAKALNGSKRVKVAG